MNSITSKVVFGQDGLVDFEATVSLFRTTLADAAAKQNADMEVIAGAVAKVWEDKADVRSMNLDALAFYASQRLDNTPDTLTLIQERVKDYIRGSKDLHAIMRGRGALAGVCLRSRLTAEELVKVEEMEKKASEKAAKAAA